MTREQAIAKCLKAANTKDVRIAAKRLIDGDKMIRNMLTMDLAEPTTWFDGMPAERYSGMDDRFVEGLLFEIAYLLASDDALDTALLCERCGELPSRDVCGPCRDDEVAMVPYEPGYALLCDAGELPW